jgi:hypothetical protein
MSCTPDAAVCDDTPSPPLDLGMLLVQTTAGLLLLALLVLLVVVLVRRRRPRRPPVTRVWVSAAGDVVQRAP